MKKIVSTGRGGSGKTTFIALLTKYFIETDQVPILLVDADPDQSLGEMVGVDIEKEGKKTVSELVYATRSSLDWEHQIWEKGLYEGGPFDLISIGTKWTEGCYCVVDSALKMALEGLLRTYWHVLIDSPAGLEHLNRRIISKVDDIFDIIDPSKKSFNHVERAHRIAKEVKIDFENFYVIGSYRFPEGWESEVEKKTKLKYLGKIAYDKKVENYILSGKSLLELPSDSPTYQSLKKIAKKAGYSTLN